jgi:hypothetical protein
VLHLPEAEFGVALHLGKDDRGARGPYGEGPADGGAFYDWQGYRCGRAISPEAGHGTGADEVSVSPSREDQGVGAGL